MERNQKEAHFRRQIEMETQLEEKKADREEKYLASTYRAAARTYGDDPEKYLEKGKKQIQRNKLDAIKRINDHYASIIKILPAEAENEVRRSIEQARAVTRQANEMGREVRISIVHRGNTWYYNPGWP
jgi:prephenate dehydrogenase